MDNRAIVAVALSAATLCACHGYGAAPLPPVGTQAAGSTIRQQRPLPARALGAIRFEPIGPYHLSDGFATSGKVNAFAVNPTNQRIIYMASGRGTGVEVYSSAGVYRTTDGGASWQSIMNGLTDSQGVTSSVVNALWLDPKHPSNLLAASEYDGIFRSSDGGTSWRNVYRTTRATQFASYENTLYAATISGLLASNDAGASWSVALPATPRRYPTAFSVVEGKSGGTFVAGMSDGTIESFAHGAWEIVGKLPYHRETNLGGDTEEVHQIAVDPLRPATIYASENDGPVTQDLFLSTDGGRTWQPVLKKHLNSFVGTQAIAFSQAHPHRLYLGVDGFLSYFNADGHTFAQLSYAANLKVVDLRNVWTFPNGKDDACWIASDQGLDYEPLCSSYSRTVYHDRVVSASATTTLARRFILSPSGKTIVASLQDFDGQLTTDGAGSWQPSISGIEEDTFFEQRPGDPHVCYAYDEFYGVRISTDDCVTFQRYHSKINLMRAGRFMTAPIAFDPNDPLTMYFVSDQGDIGFGYSGAPTGIFRSTDGGHTSEMLPWSFKHPASIVVDSHNGKHIFVSEGANYTLGAHNSAIYMTNNRGQTWTKSQDVAPTPFYYSISISPTNGQLVLASSVDASNNVFVLRSTDGGRTFRRTATIANAPPERVVSDALKGGPTPTFVYSPQREIRFNQDVTHGIADAVLTTQRGLFLSDDNGSTWHRLDGALIAHSFWGTRWYDGYLYIASDGQGILKSTTAVQP